MANNGKPAVKSVEQLQKAANAQMVPLHKVNATNTKPVVVKPGRK